jgi:hypothetical protein
MPTHDYADRILTPGMVLRPYSKDARHWTIGLLAGHNRARRWQEWVQLAEKIMQRERALRREAAKYAE